MACYMCSKNSHCHMAFNGNQTCDIHHYSDVPPVHDDIEIEPEAPTLSLGNRILWLTESRAASGIVKWIGRMPAISSAWTAGVEFDNAMPGGSNGDFRGRQYFQSRIGHAVFLPVADLLKVDSDNTPNSGERTSFFGRLQDSCSNFAHRRRRDSTFGHFKQDYCSTCARNEFSNYSHYCHKAPVYDRITTRRSLCYDDHPYEMYNPCGPCALPSNTQNHFHHNNVPNSREIEEDNDEPCIVDRRITALRPSSRTIEEYPDENYVRSRSLRRDSFFSPRPSISFINGFNGFKEWVTCLVLGTNRPKRKSKIVFKDKKMVSSVFIAQKGQSLTGQRLSSFDNYASVTVKRASNQNAALTVNDETDIDNEKDDIPESLKRNIPRHSLKENNIQGAIKGNSSNRGKLKGNISKEGFREIDSKKGTAKGISSPVDSQNVVQSKVKYRKKRPAPLPPTQHPGIPNNGRSSDIYATIKKSNNLGGGKSGVETRYKIVRSSSFRIHAVPQRRRRKKRRAPPPPPVGKTGDLEQKKISNVTTAVLNSLPGTSSDNKYHLKKEDKHKQEKTVNKVREEGSVRKLKPRKAKQKVVYQKVRNGKFVNGYSDSGEESDSENSKNSSNSVSFSEDDSDSEKYGLVKYGIINKINSAESNLSLPSTSSFVQYAGDNSDICLKISIQKTETNVVTVEEVSTPCSTTHYTIEEDSSSSELSDVPVQNQSKLKAITYEKPKLNSADSSSISTIEESADKSNTIFEELQMQPPLKGSVKDFVNAFNMLASKSYAPAVETKKQNNASSSVQNGMNDTPELPETKPKDSQSFPTNWEYQNKPPIMSYAANKFLLPIAEESHNETSEHDESKSPMIKVKNMNRVAGTEKACGIHDNSSKKCSHCFETHGSTSNNDVSKNLKKRIAPQKDCNIVFDSSRLFKKDLSSQASAAALSSLLQDKQINNVKEDKSKSVSNAAVKNTKLDQPIMVGLYIEDKSSHRGPIPLLVTPSMSLKKLKKQIEKEYEFPRHQQCWILGESFAVADEASMESYGVTEPGCPVLLYVMSKDSKSHSLPSRTFSKIRVNTKRDSSDSSEEDSESKLRGQRKSGLKAKPDAGFDGNDNTKQTNLFGAIPKTDKSRPSPTKAPPRLFGSRKRNEGKLKKTKSEFHKAWEAEFEKKVDYHNLLALDDVDLVSNVEKLECPVCFLDVEVGEGATLQECLHSFCKECLAGAIQFSENAVVKCPFRNDEYSCECHLQEREVKSLVTPEVYERHLQRSMALAESQAQDSFHCKTPDCPGWCLFEDNVNTFLCPVCKRTNCLTCAAIHEGKNCRQYQDDVSFRCDSSEEARKTKEYLQNMVDNGEAMRCPKCQVILMKKWGCDWLKCSMCHTEVCWVTKGPRWGPGGRGDTSGGCKCMVNGARCHPKCSYCH